MHRPIFRLIGQSMPIAGANMDVFIVTRGPLITIWTCPQVLILKPSFLQKRALLINYALNWRAQNISGADCDWNEYRSLSGD